MARPEEWFGLQVKEKSMLRVPYNLVFTGTAPVAVAGPPISPGQVFVPLNFPTDHDTEWHQRVIDSATAPDTLQLQYDNPNYGVFDQEPLAQAVWGQPAAGFGVIRNPWTIPANGTMKLFGYNYTAMPQVFTGYLQGFKLYREIDSYPYPMKPGMVNGRPGMVDAFVRIPYTASGSVYFAANNPGTQTLNIVMPTDNDFELYERMSNQYGAASPSVAYTLKAKFLDPAWGDWDSNPVSSRIWGEPFTTNAVQKYPVVVRRRGLISIEIAYTANVAQYIQVSFKGNRIVPQ